LAIGPEKTRKAVLEMLSLELIGILGLLFGLLVWGMVVTQRECRDVVRCRTKTEAQKAAKRI